MSFKNKFKKAFYKVFPKADIKRYLKEKLRKEFARALAKLQKETANDVRLTPKGEAKLKNVFEEMLKKI